MLLDFHKLDKKTKKEMFRFFDFYQNLIERKWKQLVLALHAGSGKG